MSSLIQQALRSSNNSAKSLAAVFPASGDSAYMYNASYGADFIPNPSGSADNWNTITLSCWIYFETAGDGLRFYRNSAAAANKGLFAYLQSNGTMRMGRQIWDDMDYNHLWEISVDPASLGKSDWLGWHFISIRIQSTIITKCWIDGQFAGQLVKTQNVVMDSVGDAYTNALYINRVRNLSSWNTYGGKLKGLSAIVGAVPTIEEMPLLYSVGIDGNPCDLNLTVPIKVFYSSDGHSNNDISLDQKYNLIAQTPTLVTYDEI